MILKRYSDSALNGLSASSGAGTMCSLWRPSDAQRARERVGRVVAEDELQPVVVTRAPARRRIP